MFKLAHNTPLVASNSSFADFAEAYGLHPTAASILDDVRFLISLTISLPADCDSQQEQKLESTASWIHNRIQALPAECSRVCKPQALAHLDSSGTHSKRNSLTEGVLSSSSTESTSQPDYVYQSIRQAALIYTSAIVARKPFSESCSLTDFYQLWTTIWRVPLTVWKALMGIFLWIEVAIVAPARGTPHGRFVKSMLTIASLNMGIENWTASSSALKRAIMLQAKLRGRNGKMVI